MNEIVSLSNNCYNQDKLPSPITLRSTSSTNFSILDQQARPLGYLRISILDQCNFRCPHCMPEEIFNKNYIFMHRADLLSFDEIARVARVFSLLGVKKIRLTGGEPLLRKNIEKLVEVLSNIQTPTGESLDIHMTTNGTLLSHKAHALKQAGLKNVTVSLDAIDPIIFAKMTGVKTTTPKDILNGIEKASKVGLSPIKVNMVVRRGVNEREILPMARHFRHSGHVLRFIEYMDVGNTNNWSFQEMVPSKEILSYIQEEYPLVRLDIPMMGRVANSWKYEDGGGEIGFISSVTDPFCSGCNRIRLSADGKLFTCLFSSKGYNLRPDLINTDFSDEMLANVWSNIWRLRQDNYSEKRKSITEKVSSDFHQKIEMSYIGG